MKSPGPCHAPSIERRQLLLGLSGIVGCTVALSAKALTADVGVGRTATLTSLRQQIDFAVKPERIYAALTESDQFASFTAMAAQIDARPGGAFSLFKGLVAGWNLEVNPSQRIVQAWRLTEEFDPGVYSVVRFDLQVTGQGTRVILNHTGFPEGHYDHLYTGWPKRYWEPLRKYVE